ncbi:MAG TPA: response regulator transcription factor [Anaerolineaceae bacterium]
MTQPKILLIGDEPNILRTLRRNLVSRGYEVSIALDDVETYEIAAQITPDLFVLNLDFTEVKVNGLDICAGLRKLSQSPMIVLSSIGEENLKIQALDLGADDYLVMPFGMEEFLARVRSALRRWASYRGEASRQEQENVIVHGNLAIHPASRQVLVHHKPIRLTPTEFGMLLYLAQRTGKVVTHQELLRSVWGFESGDQREYLRVFISQLRHKIEDDPLHPVHILTEPGLGYRFASDSYS